jgi:AcrR family transcriptional regulator
MVRGTAREKLIDAAGELFYAQGLTATGVDTVARHAGVSKPTLYAHFPSKGHLVTAVLRRRHERRVGELTDWLAPVADARQRLLAVFGWLAEYYGRDGARGCAFVNAAAELPDPGDPGRVAAQQEKDWLLDVMTAMAAEAGLARPDRLASQLLLLIDGVAGRVVVQGHSAASAALADATAVAELLVHTAETGPKR